MYLKFLKGMQLIFKILTLVINHSVHGQHFQKPNNLLY